jgi:hypothetical protein
MKTVKVKATLGIGYTNMSREQNFEFEFDDDDTEDQIEKEIDEIVKDWADNYIEIKWIKK